MLKKIFKKRKLFSRIEGNIKYQYLFTKLFNFSLRGLNIGLGYNIEKSGEKFVLQYLKNKFKNEKEIINIFDVGANIGNYSLAVLDIFKNVNCRVFSFEPSKFTYNELTKNIAGTAPNNNITLYNFGLSNENKKILLYSDEKKSALASLSNRRLEHFNLKMNETEEVEIKTLDNFCQTNKINRIHYLKLDVEGHELKVLGGGKKMIDSGAIDYIQFEFGGCDIDERIFFQDFWYILNKKYKIYRVLKNGLYPINKYREIYEVFLNTNYLAKRINIK